MTIKQGDFARFQDGFGQRFLLTVDTEEEFDWDAELSRESHTLRHLPRLARFQEFCENNSVVPLYLVDHPVAQADIAQEIIGDAVRRGAAEVGVQLHPWVSPPFEEDLSPRNSFAGNLPANLEKAKISALTEAIESKFGATPLVYRAGRYGIGPNTAEILYELGFAIDTSVRANFDYSAADGPDFRGAPLEPYWLDDARSILELPLTTVFWGLLRKQGGALYPRLWRAPRARGVLSRLGVLERIPMTPEGVTLEEAIRGIDIAKDDGLPILLFSFHSPSLAPGHTPYVRNEADLDRLFDWWRGVFAYCRAQKIGNTSIAEVMESVIR